MRVPVFERVAEASAAAVALASALGLLLVAAADLASGTELSASLFYLAPVAMLAWRAGAVAGVGAAVTAAVVWYGVDRAGGHAYSHPLIPLWNAFVRLGFFLVVCLLLVRLRRAMARETELARTDPLTGLLNRRAFSDVAGREVERSRRTGSPLGFVYLDLDDFKGVNDRHGHDTGDQVLRSVAQVMGLVMRSVDVKGRLGGDEFAMVMPDTDAAAAARAIDRLSAGLAAASIPYSMGVVVFESPPSDVAQALAKVDAVMYEAKADPAKVSAMRVVSTATEENAQVSIGGD